MPFTWTTELLAKKSEDDVKTIRENAFKKGVHELVAMCDADLIRRRPPKIPKERTTEDRRGHYVSEFHFVCPNELGVIKNSDGTLWTRTWVVAETNAEAARKYGSLVALHAKKSELSYLQGKIIDWKKGQREQKYDSEQTTKIEEGIDFLFVPSNVPASWKGDASGEKGYAWCPISNK